MFPHLSSDLVWGIVIGVGVLLWYERVHWAWGTFRSFRRPMTITLATKQTPQQVGRASRRACLVLVLLLTLPVLVAALLLLR